MEVSEARVTANRANSTLAKGPTSERGKSISRMNSLKHGLTGEGIVLLEGDQAEVESRVKALRDELQPQSALGSMLIRKIATLSVRSERAAERENAAIAERVRNAVHAFDEERGVRVDALFGAMFDSPSGAVRNLRRMPEGVDRLIEAWGVLRRDLDREGMHRWGAVQMARAVNLTGVRSERSHDTRIGDLSNALWGEFHGLTALEGGDLDNEALAANSAAPRYWSWSTTRSPNWWPTKARSTSIESSKTAAKHRPEPSSTIRSKRAWQGGTRPIRIEVSTRP